MNSTCLPKIPYLPEVTFQKEQPNGILLKGDGLGHYPTRFASIGMFTSETFATLLSKHLRQAGSGVTCSLQRW